jgi:protein involved in polysaccharide export with SLBB domain
MINKPLHQINRSLLTCGAAFVAGLVLLVALCGCESAKSPPSDASQQSAATNSLALHSGDTIKVSFPGAPNMDAQTTIRVDGKISLPMVGEVVAAGLTPGALEQELLRIAGPQLVVKQVSVSVVSSAFEIFVSGAVLRPGKIVTDRTLSPLEAVMDAGIDYQKANLKSVQIIRKLDNGQTENFKVNLQKALKGQSSEAVVLKPYDIIYVPERFNWF